jgi:transcriptional regulator with PAS, ATPase and Fis domain
VHTEKLTGDGCRVRGFRVRVVRGEAADYTPADAIHVKVGSADGNSLVVRDPTVSRFHLRLRASGSGVRVEDVGTTNGSFIGGARFRELELERDTEIAIGNSLLKIELETERVLEASPAIGRLRGRSPAMQHVLRELAHAARSKELSVLILGETGTGKEVLARTIHERGPRARAPFVVVDCAALAPTLIESQLFGHVRGAFTDAKAGSAGPFEAAHGGTVFLDEIGELPLPQQSKLLRVLQEREVVRVGAVKPVKVDVKVLAATRRDLAEEVNAGRFREDLYFRLAGEEITLPPLRERLEDLPDLVAAIVAEIVARDEALARREVPDDVLEALAARSWPGNVRELHHAVHRYLVRGELTPARSALRISAAASRLAVEDLLSLPYAEAVRRFEQRFAQHALEREDGQHAKAAKRLGIDRSTLYRILQR